MQQYRVNYTLLIGLVVGTLVCSGAVYGLWRFQIERKSGWLISEAERAHEAGDYREASRYFGQYLTIHPHDDETRIKYAQACATLSEQEDASIEELSTAWRVLEGIARDPRIVEMPEAQALQRSLVELYGRVQRVQDALDHLGYMLQRDPNNAELQVLRANYLIRAGNFDDAVAYCYKLIGYDPDRDEFDAQAAVAPEDAAVYVNLAAILHGRQNKPDLAERVMDQLVEVNPESATAYLARGRFRQTAGDTETGRDDVQKASELEPENPDVLLALVAQATNDEQYDQANEHLAAGKKLHPEDPRFYQAAADVAIKQQEYEKALAAVDEGLAAIPGQKGNVLLTFKADLQLHERDLKGVRETIDGMSRAGFPPEFIEWYEARILLAENKWFRASEALNRLRPKIAGGLGGLSVQVDNLLGLCYEKLGRPDQAEDQYKLVLDQDPQNEAARAGQMRVTLQRGLKLDDRAADPLQEMIADELRKPKAERDWKRIDAMFQELAEERQLDEATRKLFQAQLLLMREDFNGAAKALAEADRSSPNNLQIQRAMVQLVRMHPERGPAQALQRWQKVVDQFGDQAVLRLDKADILIVTSAGQQDKEELRGELAALFSGIDKWDDAEKIQLWGGMAGRYLNLGMSDEARQYLTLSAEHQPNELPLRLSLFELALQANDDAGMKDAQDKILEIVGSKNDSDWLYTEARRKLWQVRAGQLGSETLDEIRRLVSRAMQQRRDSHGLHVLNAELELQANKPVLALQHFDRAQELGRPYPLATANHIRLLAAFGRFDDAGKLLDRIPEAMRYTLLGQLYPEILFRTDQVADAIKLARTATEVDPTSAERHYWHGQLLARSAQATELSDQQRKQIMTQAIAAMRTAVELQPEFPDGWFALISLHRSDRDLTQAELALRDAQLALSGDNLQVFLARSYEALGRWFDAEVMYRALYEAAPDELPRVQQLAAFYLGPVYQLPDQQLKATPLINKILRAGSEGKIPASDPSVSWARRMGAHMLASTGDYQNLIKAANLLTSNARDGALSIEDKLELAQILAPRPEPESRKLAVQLLEEVSKIQPLNETAEIVLGELYFRTGRDWSTYSRQMERTIARYPESAAAREAYVRKLLDRTDQRSLDRAATHLNRLRQLVPGNLATFELTVRLANKLGRQEQVRADLLRRLAALQKAKELNPQQLQMLDFFAKLLVVLKDLDSAEKVYRELDARDPKWSPALAAFLGLHRDVEQCFEKLNEVYSTERLPELLPIAMSVVRQRRGQVGDKFDGHVQRWLDAGLRVNPDSIGLLMAQADLHDLRKEYDRAADVYRGLLSRNDLTGVRRAIVLNNLAFLLALSGPSAGSDADPLRLVQEAAQILGPNSDILDTRAVVFISRQQYKQALQDLELSVTDTPTASKYFHKAQAHLLAHENRAAVEAWEKAEQLGLTRDELNLMEHELYEELKSKIDQLRGASVTRAEPLRRAG